MERYHVRRETCIERERGKGEEGERDSGIRSRRTSPNDRIPDIDEMKRRGECLRTRVASCDSVDIAEI